MKAGTTRIRRRLYLPPNFCSLKQEREDIFLFFPPLEKPLMFQHSSSRLLTKDEDPFFSKRGDFEMETKALRTNVSGGWYQFKLESLDYIFGNLEITTLGLWRFSCT